MKISYVKPEVLARSNGYYESPCRNRPRDYNTPNNCKIER